MSSKKIPNIVVEPPGNRSREWLRRDEKVLSPYNRPFYYPLVVEGGEGTIVRGVDGNEYIDFMHASARVHILHLRRKVLCLLERRMRAF